MVPELHDPRRMIREAVILAAGKGTRIRVNPADLPKPLQLVEGRSLLDRTIDSLVGAGIRRVHVVTGYRGDEVREALAARQNDHRRRGFSVVTVENPEYELGNGVSVLAARARVSGPFLISMADHVYEPGMARAAASADLAIADLHLCVDRRLASVYDLDDATKVVTQGGRIREIGKHLVDYDCVDCGVFAATPALFCALDEVRRNTGDCSLSDGVRALARRGRAAVIDVGTSFWQDVDTQGARLVAERQLRMRNRRAVSAGFVQHATA